MLADPSLVATNKSYFSKSTGRTEADVLADKVIVPKNLRGTPVTRQHDTDFSGATTALSLLFEAEFLLLLSTVGLVNLTPQTRKKLCLFKRRRLPEYTDLKAS